MTGPDYEHFCTLVGQRSGLVLDSGKGYLVASRLESVARANGLADVPALVDLHRAASQSPGGLARDRKSVV